MPRTCRCSRDHARIPEWPCVYIDEHTRDESIVIRVQASDLNGLIDVDRERGRSMARAHVQLGLLLVRERHLSLSLSREI
mgnify:CR=1 FL=1